jgi:hypothetical protein
MRWAEHIARTGEKRNARGLLVGMKEGKRPLGRLRHKCENSSKMILQR